MSHQTFVELFGQLQLAQASAGEAPQVQAVGVPGESQAAPATSQTTGATGSATPAGGGTTPPVNGLGNMIFPFILVFVFIIGFQMLQTRKEQKRRTSLLNSIGKLDKVMVAGGIIGKVIELTNDEVVIQLEDGKMRLSRAAIQQVISTHAKPGSIAETKPEATTANV